MHIPNNENKGIREATVRKTLWKGKENIRHKFSRAMAKGGLLEVGRKEANGKGSGWFWESHRSRCPGPNVYPFTGIGEGAGMMHRETEGKHLVVITSELVGVGEISNPV